MSKNPLFIPPFCLLRRQKVTIPFYIETAHKYKRNVITFFVFSPFVEEVTAPGDVFPPLTSSFDVSTDDPITPFSFKVLALLDDVAVAEFEEAFLRAGFPG